MSQPTLSARPGTRFQLPITSRKYKQYEVFMIDYRNETVIANDLSDFGVPGMQLQQEYTFADFCRRTGLAIPPQPPPEPTTLF